MPLRATVFVGVVTLVAAASAVACIMPADPVEAARVAEEQVSRDREIQAALVPGLVEEADTIVIALARGEMNRALATSFLILRTVKGRATSGATVTYQASKSIPPLACTMPSEIFRNTVTESGETYLLYVRSGRLLRAIRTSRSPADISEDEELKLIAKASNSSLERTRER